MKLSRKLFLHIHAAIRLRIEACEENEDHQGAWPFRQALIWLENQSSLQTTNTKLLKALDDILTEMNESGCIEYMNESSSYATTFNKRIQAAEKAIAFAKKKKRRP